MRLSIFLRQLMIHSCLSRFLFHSFNDSGEIVHKIQSLLDLESSDKISLLIFFVDKKSHNLLGEVDETSVNWYKCTPITASIKSSCFIENSIYINHWAEKKSFFQRSAFKRIKNQNKLLGDYIYSGEKHRRQVWHGDGNNLKRFFSSTPEWQLSLLLIFLQHERRSSLFFCVRFSEWRQGDEYVCFVIYGMNN